MPGFVVHYKIVPFLDHGAGLIPVMDGATFQNIGKFQIAVRMGTALPAWTDKDVKLLIF